MTLWAFVLSASVFLLPIFQNLVDPVVSFWLTVPLIFIYFHCLFVGVSHYFQAADDNKADVNSAIVTTFQVCACFFAIFSCSRQIGPDLPALNARVEFLSHVMKEPFFNVLRSVFVAVCHV